MDDKPNRKKTFRENIDAIFNGVSRDDVKGMAKDTLKDLKNPKELAALGAAIIIPAGIPAYLAYRLLKYKQQQAANDNNPKQKPKPPQPGKGKPSR